MRDADEITGPDVARGQDGGGTSDLGDNFFWRQPVLPQLLGIDSYYNRSLVAAKWGRRRYAWQRREDGPHLVQRDVLHLGDASRGTREDKLGRWNAAGVEPHDERRHRARWHKGSRPVHVTDHFRHSLTH